MYSNELNYSSAMDPIAFSNFFNLMTDLILIILKIITHKK